MTPNLVSLGNSLDIATGPYCYAGLASLCVLSIRRVLLGHYCRIREPNRCMERSMSDNSPRLRKRVNWKDISMTTRTAVVLITNCMFAPQIIIC